MAQLTDDCFAFGGPLLAIDDVERLINERVTPVTETEAVPLKGARGRAVRRRVRVAVFAPGDELVDPGAPLPAAGLYDANRELLRGLLARLETQGSDLGILRDDRARLSARLAEAAQGQDLVLTSG